MDDHFWWEKTSHGGHGAHGAIDGCYPFFFTQFRYQGAFRGRKFKTLPKRQPPTAPSNALGVDLDRITVSTLHTSV